MNYVLNLLLFLVFITILIISFIVVNTYVNKFYLINTKPNFTKNEKIADKNIDSNNTNSTEDDKTSWIKALQKETLPNFSYPAQELFITLDFSNTKKTNILTISNLNSYKFFCLNEILKSNNIKFTYIKNNELVKLEIALDRASLKEKLTEELKKYNISYNIK